MSSLPRFRAFFPSSAIAVLVTAALLAGCGADQVVPPCPPVRIDNATANLDKFADGKPADPGNLEYSAQVVGYKGQCVFSKKMDRVDVRMDIDFALAPGPAAKREPVDLYYFVAVPQLFPDPDGKKIMEIRRELPARGGKAVRIRESTVHVILPLKKDQAAASFDVYVGMQLTPDQLAYNRAHPR